ncbi:hypothetical protein EZI54_07175 [Marinobacter halodurans]|uniref:XRE family transcriptional regulator n=1 Tax=Marinobacter halodurans TaxID=2528979 RepID=A0ABY1ZMF1_9GAMM|nr:hypothetical protein [Marinobacter halodurans]TBW57433.1 hypothetical protein EZI54_07175 [Marinobacter halodurans]
MTQRQPNSVDNKPPQTPAPSLAEAFGARFRAALMYARLTPAGLYRRLVNDYGLSLSRASIYDAYDGRVARPKYVYEVAEITGVNLPWLIQGRGVMVDISGRVSSREEADRLLRITLRQHVIPTNRNDLIRVADRFLDKLYHHDLSATQSDLLDRLLLVLNKADSDQLAGLAVFMDELTSS